MKSENLNDNPAADRLVGIPQIAPVVGVCNCTLRKMAKAGTNGIPVRWVGTRWWASRRELTAWLDAQVAR